MRKFAAPFNSDQWRSQGEQVTWAQHGHIWCTHLLYWGMLPRENEIYTLRSLLRSFLATNTIISVLPVCLLHMFT